MSRISKKEGIQRKQRLAEIIYDMEQGLFDYPDGKAPFTKGGKARVNKKLALLEAGYAPTYVKTAYYKVFDDPVYTEQYSLVKRQRAGGVMKALELAQSGSMAVTRISEGLLNMLADRIEHEPDGIKTQDLLKYAHVYFRLGAELEGKLQTKTPDRLAIVLAAVDARLPAESRAKVAEKLAEFRAMRSQEVIELEEAGSALDNAIETEWTEDEESTG